MIGMNGMIENIDPLYGHELSAAPSSRVSNTRAYVRWAMAFLVFGVVGGLVGAYWMSNQTPNYEAVARASFTDWIEPGATDAERARIISHAGDEARSRAESEFDNVAIEYITPNGRNFVDVHVEAEVEGVAVLAANATAKVLVELETSEQISRIDEKAERARETFDQIQIESDRLEAEMAIHLAAEAAAEGDRLGADVGATVEEAIIAARLASDQYWEAARRRNALVDEQNGIERTLIRLEDERAASSDFELSAPATSGELLVETSWILGFFGGFALVAGSLLFLWALVDSRP